MLCIFLGFLTMYVFDSIFNIINFNKIFNIEKTVTMAGLPTN